MKSCQLIWLNVWVVIFAKACPPCAKNMMPCGDHACTCFYSVNYCDLKPQCPNREDEKNCNSGCKYLEPPFRFICRNRHCISSDEVCNGVKDCADGSDEDSCEPHCFPEIELTCLKNKRTVCLPKSYLCDEVNDCDDAIDEADCLPAPKATTRCNSPHIPKQISDDLVCNYITDCYSNEDELVKCFDYKCQLDYHKAKMRKCADIPMCIPSQLWCDGVIHCPDGSDEKRCQNSKPISQIACQTGSCAHSCFKHGECTCMNDFVLDTAKDNRSCIPRSGEQKSTIFVVGKINIYYWELNTKSQWQSLLDDKQDTIHHIDVHYQKKTLFYTHFQKRTIYKVKYDAKTIKPEVFFKYDKERPGNIAVDWVHNMLYWVVYTAKSSKVIVSKINNASIQTELFSSGDFGKDALIKLIALHPVRKLMYVLVLKNDKSYFYSSYMDGSKMYELNSTSYDVAHFVVDYQLSFLYFTVEKRAEIYRMELSGSYIIKKIVHNTPLLKFQTIPRFLAVFNDVLYFTSPNISSIYRVHPLSMVDLGEQSFQIKVLPSIYPGIGAIVLAQNGRQGTPSVESKCNDDNNGGCESICLPTPDSATCRCPIGYTTYAVGQSCSKTPTKSILFAVGSSIYRKHIGLPGDPDMIFSSKETITAIASTLFDKNIIYFASMFGGTISMFNLTDTSKTKVIVQGLSGPQYIVVDSMARNIYYTCKHSRTFEVVSHNGSFRTVLFTFPENEVPNDLTILSDSWEIYIGVTVKNSNTKGLIKKFAIEGQFPHTLVELRNAPLGLTSHLSNIYWIDSENINYCDFKDCKVKQLSPLNNVMKSTLITVDSFFIYAVVSKGDDENFILQYNIDDKEKSPVKFHSVYRPYTAVATYNIDDVLESGHCRKHNCSHLCVRSVESSSEYKCLCPLLYEMAVGSQTKCVPKIADVGVFSSGVALYAMDLSATYHVTSFLLSVESVVYFDYDPIEQEIYFFNSSFFLLVQPISGIGKQRIVTQVRGNPVTGFAIDFLGRNLYWAVRETGIFVSKIDGTNTKILYAGQEENNVCQLYNPTSLTITRSGYLYYVEDCSGQNSIAKMSLNGDFHKYIIGDPTKIHSLAMNDNKHLLYFMANEIIYQAPFSERDSKREVLKLDLHHRISDTLVLYKDSIFWADGKDIKSVPRSDEKPILMTQVSFFVKQTIFRAIPNNARRRSSFCSHLSLRDGETKISCACPTGIALRKTDPSQCEDSPKEFFSFPNSQVPMNIDKGVRRSYTFQPFQNHQFKSTDFSYEGKRLFFSDLYSIISTDFNGENAHYLISSEEYRQTFPKGAIVKIAVDWSAGNIFWTDSSLKKIFVMRIKKPKINPLISEGLFEPCAIAVNPEKRYVFWSDLSTGTIERAYMDGKHRTKIAENYFGVKSIAIDYHENRLYFTSENSIFISDLNGKDIQTVVKLHNPPFGITIMNKHIFYIADSSFKSIRKTSRQTLTSNYFTIVGGQFLRTLTDVRYVADDVQLGQSVCIESKCSFLCLPNKKGYGCACPPQEDCKDGTTTVEIPSKVQSSNQHVSDKGLSSKPTKKAVTTINCGPQSNCFNSSNS